MPRPFTLPLWGLSPPVTAVLLFPVTVDVNCCCCAAYRLTVEGFTWTRTPEALVLVISMALIFGKSAEPVVNWMVIELAGTVTGKDLSIAVNGAPDAATISKLESTWVPLIEALKILFPAAVQ